MNLYFYISIIIKLLQSSAVMIQRPVTVNLNSFFYDCNSGLKDKWTNTSFSGAQIMETLNLQGVKST